MSYTSPWSVRQPVRVLFLLCLPILHACKKNPGDTPAAGGSGTPPVTTSITTSAPPVLDTSKNILLITDKAASDVTLIDDSTLSVSSLANIKNLNRPSAGEQAIAAIGVSDILVSNKGTRLPNGLMASVAAVRKGSDGSWILHLIDAGLENVYKKINFSWPKQFDIAQTQDSFNVNIPVGLTKLNVKGSYRLLLTSKVDVDVEDAQLKKAVCSIEGDIFLKAKSTLSLQTLQKDTTITLKEIPLVNSDQLSIGKVSLPFVLTATLRINLVVKASGTMQLSASYDFENTSYVSLTYDGGLPIPGGAFLKDTVNKTGMTSTIAGTFSAGIQAQAKASFFKSTKAGLTAGLTVLGTLKGDCNGTGITLKGSISCEGDVGGEINLFNLFPLSKSITIFNISQDLFTKTIDDGGLCSADFPPVAGNAGSHGDVHSFTFDSKTYDFQSFGEFVAVQGDGLTVQARQGSIGSDKRVTFNKALVISEGADTVEFQLEPLKLYINKTEQSLNSRIRLSGRGYVESTGSTVTVRLSNGDRLDIVYYSRGYLDYQVGLVDAHRGKITGLLGNWNGAPGDDVLQRTGEAVSPSNFQAMYPGYANSWRIRNEESLFYYEPGNTTANFTDYTYPSIPVSLTAAQLAAAQQTCSSAGVTKEPALSNCIVDVGVTGDAGYAESALGIQDQFQLTDPVCWLPLDGDAKDKSPWSNDGNLMGEYTFTTDRKGRPNSALSLNGKGYVDVPNNLVIKGLSQSVTVTGWLLVTKYYNGWAPFVCKSAGGQSNPLQVVLTSTSIGCDTRLSPLPQTLTLNVWHHIAMVLEGGIKTYYVDGVSLLQQQQGVAINEGDLLMGSDPYGAQEYLYGALDDMKIYNRSLSAAEIKSLMQE